MTTKEMDSRQLDALVAEKIFGYQEVERVGERWQFRNLELEKENGGVWRSPVPHYSTDIADAWAVVDALVAKGMRVSVHNRAVGPWACWIGVDLGTEKERAEFEYGETPSLAICLAALRAVGEPADE